MEKQRKFFNRELSWLEFNYRVLEEALDKNNPVLERLKFLAIFSNNLDEFFMVRISGLISQIRSGYNKTDPSGQTPGEILSRLELRIQELVALQYRCYRNDVVKILENEKIFFYTAQTINEQDKINLKDIFMEKYFLILTPMAIDQARPFPFINGKGINLLIKLENPRSHESLYAIIPLPTKNRFIQIPSTEKIRKFILIEEFIKLFSEHFFNGYKILKTCSFRITRDAEFNFDEEEVADLLLAIENELKKREKGSPIRLEVEHDADQELVDFLAEKINFYQGFNFLINGPLDLSAFFQICSLAGHDHLKAEKLSPITPNEFMNKKIDIFELISNRDILLHHPFQSFSPVIRFIEEAAVDPKVLAIKQTLYRTSGDSPIIKALKQAAENGKQVTVLVELKARFDEAQNITWAKQLEQVGCHVIYGLVGLKTHCKLALVVRDEEEGIKRYLHLSTGNYNDKTARIYTDMGIFTAKLSFCKDVSAIFNLLTGYSDPPRWKKLITAPLDLRNFFLEKINIEKENAKKGIKSKILAKMNSLIDRKIILALYEASQSGVQIDLLVRGMCRLIPGLKGLSENIRVYSIVDLFLEHSRIYYFYNNGNEDIFLSSADWMERNFDRRVEIAYPIENQDLKDEIKYLLDIGFNDRQKLRILNPDGQYVRVKTRGKSGRSQFEIYDYYRNRNIQKKSNQKVEFIPKLKLDDNMKK